MNINLPNQDELTHADETLVYQYDLNEWYSDTPFNYFCFAYKNRIFKIFDLCNRYLQPGQKILDIGCAQGNLALLLAEKGYEVTACDINPHFIRYAQRKHTTGNITFLTGNFFEVIPEGTRFNLVIATEIIEHVAYPEELLAHIHNLLLPGGICILSTPNGGYFKNTLPTFKQIQSMISREELEARQFQPEGDDHLFLFTQPELEQEVKNSQFELLSFNYLNSVLVSILSRLLSRFKSRSNPTLFYQLDRLLCLIPGFQYRFSNSLVICVRKPACFHLETPLL